MSVIATISLLSASQNVVQQWANARNTLLQGRGLAGFTILSTATKQHNSFLEGIEIASITYKLSGR